MASQARELDYRWAPATAISGIAGVVAYFVLGAADPSSAPLAVALTFTFAFGITVSSIGLYHVLGGPTGSPLALIAAVANVVGAGQLLAMIMVQMAVKAVVNEPGAALTAVWLGLDVAWDLYVGTGTVLFGLCMFLRRQFGAWLSVSGLVLGGLLLILNIATFPTPPVNAGLVDLGPVVGLWWVVMCGRLGVASVLAKKRLRTAAVALG